MLGIPTALVGLYAYRFTPNEDDLHAKLREKYPDKINASENNMKEMKIFFDKMKKQSPETNQQFEDLMKEGKSRRHS